MNYVTTHRSSGKLACQAMGSTQLNSSYYLCVASLFVNHLVKKEKKKKRRNKQNLLLHIKNNLLHTFSNLANIYDSC